MWKYLTLDKYNEILLSFNLVNTTNIKEVNKILYNVSNNIDANYEEIIIHKKTGGLRFLNAPSKTLKSIQKRILKNVLEEKKTSNYSYAYIKGYSIIDNAKPHVNKSKIVKLDIKDFFDNINFNMVYNTCFNETLYPKKLGMLFTNLCTYNNSLPQGAPTSGYISNIVLRGFDEKIGLFCKNNDIEYTRYSDDMTFSGDFNTRKLIKKVNELLYEEGFCLNKKKIVVVNKKTRQQVTGIVVNEKLGIRKSYKKKIRQEVYYINKFGLKCHLIKRKIKLEEKDYLNKLLGKINFVLQVEKNNLEFQKYKNYVTHLIRRNK